MFCINKAGRFNLLQNDIIVQLSRKYITNGEFIKGSFFFIYCFPILCQNTHDIKITILSEMKHGLS